MAKKAGYIALVLDQKAQLKLKQLAVHPHVHATHVTLAHKPEIELYDKFKPLMGCAVEFEIDGMAVDYKGQALKVTGLPVHCGNKHPHITVSCAEGVPPRYSNELLDKPSYTIDYKESMRGTIQFIPFSQ